MCFNSKNILGNINNTFCYTVIWNSIIALILKARTHLLHFAVMLSLYYYA